MYQLSEDVARKVLDTVDAGLVRGKGEPKPGMMCVEAAVCFALGLPHSDAPPCVGHAVRAVKIRLNDANWSSNTARTRGMRRVAIAQLGSDKLDQRDFVKRLSTEIIRQLVPRALRAASSVKANAKHKDALEDAAKKCEDEPTEANARSARKIAVAVGADATYFEAASAAAADAAYVAYVAADAANAADAAADADAAAGDVHLADVAADAAADAAADVANAADVAAYVADATGLADARDNTLSLAAEIIVGILKDMGSPGCEWLYLTEEPQ